MSNTKHSPGPWAIKPDPTEYSLKAISYQYEYEANEFASVWVARELSEENAKLIAAAPELLEALNMCINAVAALANKSIPANNAWEAAKSAIKKATE